MLKSDPFDLKKWPLERLNEIYLFAGHGYYPGEAPAKIKLSRRFGENQLWKSP